ncbi:MAG TPA: ester cyclase [Thermoanaerobaculia bacterium]|nr:ester cyclase [Thermoanaerobaculia bacterium]
MIARLLAILLLTLALPGLAQAPAGAAPPTPEVPAGANFEANKALVRRYIEEALSGGDLKVLDLIVAPNYVDNSPGAEDGRGPEVIRAAQGRIRALFKDIHYHVDQLVAEGDRVVARYTVRAVRQADQDADSGDAGREINILGMTFFRIAAGRIVETWTINDQFSMFRQLGYALTSPKEQQKAGAPAAKPQPP